MREAVFLEPDPEKLIGHRQAAPILQPSPEDLDLQALVQLEQNGTERCISEAVLC